jgi:hypothetical protein
VLAASESLDLASGTPASSVPTPPSAQEQSDVSSSACRKCPGIRLTVFPSKFLPLASLQLTTRQQVYFLHPNIRRRHAAQRQCVADAVLIDALGLMPIKPGTPRLSLGNASDTQHTRCPDSTSSAPVTGELLLSLHPSSLLIHPISLVLPGWTFTRPGAPSLFVDRWTFLAPPFVRA